MLEDAVQAARGIRRRVEHELKVAGAGVLDTVVNNKITTNVLGGINDLYKKITLAQIEAKPIRSRADPYLENTYFYDRDSLSIELEHNNDMVPIYPLNFSLDLEFENEEQYNMKGQLVGVLRSFSGGTLDLELPENVYFFDQIYSAYTEKISIYIHSEEQNLNAKSIDKIICLLEGLDFSTGEIELKASMRLRVLQILRMGSNEKDFMPLFPINVPYFVPVARDDCFLDLVYGADDGKGSELDRKITLYNIVGFQHNHKNRSEVKIISPSGKQGLGVPHYLYNGLEPATFTLTANIYDVFDIDYLKELVASNRRGLASKSLSSEEQYSIITKEEQVAKLYELFESYRRTRKEGARPYEISIQSSLIAGLKPTNFGYYLQEIDIKGNARNYLEVELKFIEIREYGRELSGYVAKEEFVYKRDTSYEVNLLSRGRLSSDLEHNKASRLLD
ncbi:MULTISPECIES: hypothetical protein [unclassified Borrelia]|uniref:hypothetical protein n=1 Tax=unclassified Borrelia TaxID=2649934 RepID=UPI001E341D96|nr:MULTISPECIES: hypothetical protein [unclassified Borrelia]UGQ16689.1 hypothetical protein LSO06_05060 [Borrelia sp. RT5S]UGQ17847.1 hypothetical protein LSO05_05295 [Borrelia sp. RT1S]